MDGTDRSNVGAPAVIDEEGRREIFVRPDPRGGWTWWVADAPGWSGHADTRDEALFYAGWWLGGHDAEQPAEQYALPPRVPWRAQCLPGCPYAEPEHGRGACDECAATPDEDPR